MAVFTRGLSGLREEDFFALLHEDSLRCSTRSSVRRGEGEKKDWKKKGGSRTVGVAGAV